MGCGCGDRQAALNRVKPGLGDKTKEVIGFILETAADFISWLLLFDMLDDK